jgi:hypothetical protein
MALSTTMIWPDAISDAKRRSSPRHKSGFPSTAMTFSPVSDRPLHDRLFVGVDIEHKIGVVHYSYPLISWGWCRFDFRDPEVCNRRLMRLCAAELSLHLTMAGKILARWTQILKIRKQPSQIAAVPAPTVSST